MIYLLEIRLIGGPWVPRRILDEPDIHQALDNLYLEPYFFDWRVKRINRDAVVRTNALITLQWSL